MKKLLKVYDAILKLGPWVLDDKGKIGILMDEKLTEWTVNDKPVALGTNHVLHNSDKYEIFHPFSENILGGPPQTAIMFRDVLLIMFNKIYMREFFTSLAAYTNEDDHTVDEDAMFSQWPSTRTADLKHILKLIDEYDCFKMDVIVSQGPSSDRKLVVSSPLLDVIVETLSDTSNKNMVGNVKGTKRSLTIVQDTLLRILGVKPKTPKLVLKPRITSGVTFLLILDALTVLGEQLATVLPEMKSMYGFIGLLPKTDKQMDSLIRSSMAEPTPAKSKTKKKKKKSAKAVKTKPKRSLFAPSPDDFVAPDPFTGWEPPKKKKAKKKKSKKHLKKKLLKQQQMAMMAGGMGMGYPNGFAPPPVMDMDNLSDEDKVLARMGLLTPSTGKPSLSGNKTKPTWGQDSPPWGGAPQGWGTPQGWGAPQATGWGAPPQNGWGAPATDPWGMPIQSGYADLNLPSYSWR